MPLYEYLCDACGHRFEVIRKFSDAPLDKCPKCGGSVHKLQSAPAIQFKGSGFYITDYAKKESSPAGKSDSGSKSGEAAAKSADAKSADGGGKNADSSGKSGDSGGKSEASASAPATPAPAKPDKP